MTTRGRPCSFSAKGCQFHSDAERRRERETGLAERAPGILPTSVTSPSPAVPVQRASGYTIRAGRYVVPGVDPNPDIREERGFGTPWGDAGIFWDLFTSIPVAQLVYRLIAAVLTSRPADFRYERQAEGDPEILDRTKRAYFDDLESWDRYISQATMSLIFGFMPFEVEERLARDGAHVPSRFLQRMPWSIWRVHRQNERLFGCTQRAQRTDDGPIENIFIPASQMIWHVHDLMADHYTGMSVLRPAYGPLSSIRNLWRYAMMAAQRTGVPMLVEHLSKQDYEDIETKDDVFASLQAQRATHNSTMVLPAGEDGKASLEVVGGEFNADGLIQLERAMAWNVLSVCGGQFLALGTTDTGSRAVGDVHSRVFYMTMDAKAKELCLPINDTSDHAPIGSVRWFVDSNYGPQDVYPTLYIPTPRADTVSELATALKILVDAKLLTPTAQDQSRLREEFQMPQLDKATSEAVQEHIYRIGGTDPEVFAYDQANGILTRDEVRERKGFGPDADKARGKLTVPEFLAKYGQTSQQMGAQ